MVDIEPDIIFTHSPNDYHSDHRNLSKIITDCWQGIVFFADTMAGVDFEPQYYVDISSQFEQKKSMLMEHKTQLDSKVVDMIELQNRFRGLQCNWGMVTKYAEAFRVFNRIYSTIAYNYLPY